MGSKGSEFSIEPSVAWETGSDDSWGPAHPYPEKVVIFPPVLL